MGSPQRLWAVGAVLCAAGVAGLVALLAPSPAIQPPAQPSVAQSSAGPGWSLLALGGADRPSANAAPQAPRPPVAPEDLWHTLLTDGSLRGAELDGAWGAWDGRRLTPSADLRRRFDQLLTTLGETRPDELRLLVAWLAERDLGAPGAQAVLEVWDRYLKLQQHAFRETMDLGRPERWASVLQERQWVRRELLGMAWADAFYREEETALRQRLDRPPQTQDAAEPVWTAAAPAGLAPQAWHHERVAALGQEAADRLQAEERAQAEWEQRLTTARSTIERLSRAPELSPGQRQEAVQNWLNQHFQGSERLRASALLGL